MEGSKKGLVCFPLDIGSRKRVIVMMLKIVIKDKKFEVKIRSKIVIILFIILTLVMLFK